jgi:exopolyphosphatase / guanosine-5'-triphosphate,3'-diphosphate pyrophosphatase
MVVGELRSGQLAIIDRLKETVRLSEGLKPDGDLGKAAKKRALDCLARFGQRLREIRVSSVRAAGTSTLRRARDSAAFRREAEKALGHPIEVISGIEEARLIYSGVTQSMPPWDGPRLVMDIGGGSTELIAGMGATPQSLESLHLGCVAMTEAHFPGGRISPARFEQARLAARLEIAPVKAFFQDVPGREAIGTSGTILATAAAARELGVSDAPDLTRAAVERLIERVLGFGDTASLDVPGLPEGRAEVWPGGLAILAELLRALGVERLRVSEGALREGLLYDQLGRLRHEDARERSVEAMARRFSVDRAQAGRVAATARDLLAQVEEQWQLSSPLAKQLLSWGAALHEIGLDISHDGYQRHGAYVVENADMPGFPRSEQLLLAFLIANQRRELKTSAASSLPTAWHRPALRLALLLRLAVLLNRSRSTEPLPLVRLTAGSDRLTLRFPPGWLDQHPLTNADLAREHRYLLQAKIGLQYN